MQQNQKRLESSKVHWSERPVIKNIAGVLALAAIFGLGYGVCSFKNDLEKKIDQATALQDCNEKLNTERIRFEDLKSKFESQQVQALTKIIEQLKGHKND